MRASGSIVRLSIVGVLLLGSCGGSKGSTATTLATTTVTAAPDVTAGTELVDTHPTGEVIPAALWAVTTSGDLLHLDPDSGEILGTTTYSTAPDAYASGVYLEGNLWLADARSFELMRVSTVDGSITERIPPDGASPCCLVAGDGQLWSTDVRGSFVSRLDPSTGRVINQVAVDEPYGRVVIGPDAVYVLLEDSDKVIRLDGSGTVTASTTVADLSIDGAVTTETLWVTNKKGLVALDATTLAPIRAVEGIFPFDLQSIGDELWVADAGDALTQIDGATGEVAQSVTMTDPQRLEVAEDRVYVVDKEGRIYRATSQGLASLPGTPKGIVQVIYSPAHHSDGSPAATTATTQPTEQPSATEVPVGVRWEEVQLPSDAGLSHASHVVAAGNGYIVLGTESQPGGARPAIWLSADGSAFARADTAALSPPGSHISLWDAAAANGTTIAVGDTGSDCQVTVADFVAICTRRDAVAWVSADGQTWRAANAADGSFEEGLETSLGNVVATSDGFVAVGQVILDRNDWRVGVWTSPDGHTWTRAALLADPGGLFQRSSLAVAGTTLVISATLTRCETPLDVYGGFGFTDPASSGRAFTSMNGIDWAPIDLVAAGLAEDRGSESCQPEAEGAGYLPSGVTEGVVTRAGDSAVWTGVIGIFVSADGGAWTRVPDPPDFSSTTDRLRGRLIGTGTSDLLRLAAGDVVGGQVDVQVAAFDGTEWRDWSELAGGIASFGTSDIAALVGLNDAVKGATAAVAVGTASDDTGASVHATGFVSRATTFDP